MWPISEFSCCENCRCGGIDKPCINTASFFAVIRQAQQIRLDLGQSMGIGMGYKERLFCNNQSRFGSLSCCGSALDSRYQIALDAQNIFCIGRICGSLSNVPAGTTTDLPLLANQGSDEPQSLQNDVAKNAWILPAHTCPPDPLPLTK